MKCSNCGRDNPPEASFCGSCGKALGAPQAAPKAAPPAVALVPGITSSYGNAWRKLWPNFLVLFLILIITIVLSAPGMASRAGGAVAAVLGIFVFAYSILVSNPVGYGSSFAYLKAARGDKVEVKDMFAAFGNYWNAVLASLLVSVITFIGVILLIIPGIYLGCKLAFTPFLVVDRKMAVIDAVKESWRMTGGHGWKVFLIGLLAIPIVIAGAICLGVGIIISIMWISLALASLYHAVSTSGEVAVKQGGPVT